MNKLKVITFSASIVLLAGIVYFSNPYKIYEAILSTNKFYILIAVGFSVLNIFLRVAKWKVLVHDINFFELFPIQMLGMSLSSLTPGKIAEPGKSVLLKIRKGIPVSVSLPTIIWERINDIICIIILSLVAIQSISLKSNLFIISVASISVFILLIALLLLTLHRKSFGRKVFNLVKKLPGAKSISEEFMESFYNIKTDKSGIIKSFIITLITWIIEGIILYFVLLSLNINSNFILLAGIISLSAIIGIASSLPGGIGSLEFVMIFLLGINGIGGAVAVSAVFIYRIIAFWFSILVGGLSFVYLSKKIDMKDMKLE